MRSALRICRVRRACSNRRARDQARTIFNRWLKTSTKRGPNYALPDARYAMASGMWPYRRHPVSRAWVHQYVARQLESDRVRVPTCGGCGARWNGPWCAQPCDDGLPW